MGLTAFQIFCGWHWLAVSGTIPPTLPFAPLTVLSLGRRLAGTPSKGKVIGWELTLGSQVNGTNRSDRNIARTRDRMRATRRAVVKRGGVDTEPMAQVPSMRIRKDKRTKSWRRLVLSRLSTVLRMVPLPLQSWDRYGKLVVREEHRAQNLPILPIYTTIPRRVCKSRDGI
jgi:hypothetical protein